MTSRPGRWWLLAQIVLAVALLAGLGHYFAGLLQRPEWRERPLEFKWGWLILAGGLYALSLACWGGFWTRLVRREVPSAPFLPILGSYYVSHFGKYIPGKALVLVVRAAFGQRYGVPPATSALTGLYETLTSMACGACIATIAILTFDLGDATLLWVALGVLAVTGLPLLPGALDRLAERTVHKYLPADHPPPPRLSYAVLAEGFAIDSIGWVLLGVSLMAVFAGMSHDVTWSPRTIALFMGGNALAYVCGFLTLFAPGGLGVRELVLQRVLVVAAAGATLDEASAVMVTLVLRVVWTVTEVVVSGGFLMAWWAFGRGR